jgi:hypothetical protein
VTFTCGNCAATFATKADKRHHKQKCGRNAIIAPDRPCGDEDLYGLRFALTPAQKAEADRQWAELDATRGDPAAITTWVRNGIRQDDARAATLVENRT